METAQAELLYPDLSYQIQGCFFKVYNTLGFGHKEVVYQRSLGEELNDRGIPFEREKALPVNYGSKKVGEYRPDFVISESIIVEVKALEYMPKKFVTQLVYYLKGTSYRLGYLVNFGSPKIQIIRKIWSREYRMNTNHSELISDNLL